MKIIYYIRPSIQDKIRLNQLMWDNYVHKDDNYIFPFCEGTLNYYDVNNELLTVTSLLEAAANDTNLSQDDRDFITQQLTVKKTRQEWAQFLDQPILPFTPPQ